MKLLDMWTDEAYYWTWSKENFFLPRSFRWALRVWFLRSADDGIIRRASTFGVRLPACGDAGEQLLLADIVRRVARMIFARFCLRCWNADVRRRPLTNGL